MKHSRTQTDMMSLFSKGNDSGTSYNLTRTLSSKSSRSTQSNNENHESKNDIILVKYIKDNIDLQ